MEINPICRLCWTKDVELINVFDEKGVRLKISTIVGQHLWIQMQKNDAFSEYICTTCWWKLENFHMFYTQIYELHKSGNSNNQRNNFKSELEHLTLKVSDEENEPVTSAIKIELDVLNENFVENISANSRQDPYESCDALENDSDFQSDEDYVEEVKTDKPKSKRSQSLKTKSSKKTLTTEKTKTNRQQIAIQNEQISQFCKMECDLCPDKFTSFPNAVSHYRNVHKVKGYLTCCSKKYFKRCRALEHIRLHINPESNKCDICGKVFCERRTLNNHMETHLNPDKKIFKCDKCPKSFLKKFQLHQHQLRHGERTFPCDECGKCYVSETVLKSHKRGVHEGAFVQICDICAKTFKSKMFFEQHMKVAHSDIPLPKVQCPQCGVWLKHEHSLRSHVRRHIEEKNLYICNVCGKQAPNRGALRSHKIFAHTLERTHTCEICSKAFKRPLSLKEHMTTHTGEVLYSCPFCPKTFNSSANMHAHKKKIHPIEWAENKKKD